MHHRYWLSLAGLLVVAIVAQSAAAYAAPAGLTRAKAAVLSGTSDSDICDPLADYYLGMEDYPKTVALHRAVILRHPDRALAYYHLGFAYGMLGDHQLELINYQRALRLGLDNWELFLNLGRVYLESGQTASASDAFRLVTLLAPLRPEGHYNLGLAYERLGLLAAAEQETLLALRLRPDQIEARNSLAIIYAEEGKSLRAHQEWSELIKIYPTYAPARANLAILEHAQTSAAQNNSRPAADFTQTP